uniref:OXP1 n=1 Tax=Arundo donax TaxID=35708 RepID=A0A0A9CQP9_ARUDO
MHPSLRKNAHNNRPAEFNLPYKAITTSVETKTSAVLPDAESVQKNRVSLLKDLGVSHRCVCHVTLNTTCAIPGWASSATTSNSLVVTKGVISKGQIVHTALRAGTGLERHQDNIRRSLRG